MRNPSEEFVKFLLSQLDLSTPAPPPPIPVLSAPAAAEAASESGSDASKTVTTAEELDLFERVKKIVAQSPLKTPVVYKDTATYFGVNLGPVRRWFLRFFGNGSTKYIVLRMPYEALQASLGAMNAMPFGAAETRVNVSSGADIDRIPGAILAAYEAEVRRKDSDSSGDSSAGT